jgi:multicomponent Na+:H+ antiporter subunit D
MSGFISKWYLAEGALSAQIGVLRYVGPAVLLISALLTAGYLLPVTIDGFLPGKDFAPVKEDEAPDGMLLPLVFLAVMTVLFGLFPNALIGFVGRIASALL